ncbi:MAG: replication-associated recombination protein A [Gammaproteobacteria bacterium]|jgi:putative ATPase|nr:replication-associated recombination protein A [Gammaproteobacteria bacterium]
MAAPLAERMRPASLQTFKGQQHLLGEGKPLRQAIESGHLHSMLFWGPPGTGKTTLARLIARHSNADFLSISAVLSGVKEIRAAIEQAKQSQQLGKSTLLFVDEVHRFNKSQQDAFLPHVEDGTFTFVGATTENPSFELNNALLSRARLYRLKSLEPEALVQIVQQALEHEAEELRLSEAGLQQITTAADGDARRALNILEIVIDLATPQEDGSKEIDEAHIAQVVVEGSRRFDKGGDAFYEQISALHKSVRGSNPDAALYWFARMIDGGVDPLYVARRVVRMASEDIGNADPRALQITLNAWDTYERLGSPEGELAIAQAISYLAVAPKSNAIYKAWNRVLADVKAGGSAEVPVHLRNAPTKVMKELGYGHAYRYAHDEPEAYAAGETYFPDALGEQRYYEPVERGMEIKIKQRMDYLQQLDQQARQA